MKIKFSKLDIEIETEVKDEKEAIRRLAFWQSLPDVCPECGSRLSFQYREPQNFKYYGLICVGNDSHETNFGQHQTGESLYYKKDWREAFSNHPQNESKKEILIGEVAQLAKVKGVELKAFALGMSNNQTNNIDNLSIEQLESGLELLKKK